MKVIGAGFGRTGTRSLQLALDQLGYKTYHMLEAVRYSNQMIEWGRYARGEISEDEILDLVASWGYTAGVDFPICSLYQTALKRHPDTRVILSVRDPAEVWAKSFTDTIGNFGFWAGRPPMSFMRPGFGDLINRVYTDSGMSVDPDTQVVAFDSAVEAYNALKIAVQAAVPSDQLLVFQAKDGWEPLCAFLGVQDCPSKNGEKYPRALNDRALMMRLDTVMSFMATYWVSICALLVLYVVAALRRLVIRCCCGRSEKRKSA